MKSEERLIPTIRARLAQRLSGEGLHVKEIAQTLNVTQAAVTQYLKKKRGAKLENVAVIDHLVDPLAEKLLKRRRSGLGGIETIELLETARQLMTFSAGNRVITTGIEGNAKD